MSKEIEETRAFKAKSKELEAYLGVTSLKLQKDDIQHILVAVDLKSKAMVMNHYGKTAALADMVGQINTTLLKAFSDQIRELQRDKRNIQEETWDDEHLGI